MKKAILVCCLLGVVMWAVYPRTPQKVQTVTYTVTSDETLWDIAEKTRSESQDVREEIFNIAQQNGLKMSEPLPAGKTLTIDIYK